MASVIAPFFVFYCFPSANVVKKIVRTNTIVIVLVADLIKELKCHYKKVLLLYINPNDKINPELLSMAGTIPMPSQEEIDSDPRLKAALGI